MGCLSVYSIQSNYGKLEMTGWLVSMIMAGARDELPDSGKG